MKSFVILAVAGIVIFYVVAVVRNSVGRLKRCENALRSVGVR